MEQHAESTLTKSTLTTNNAESTLTKSTLTTADGALIEH